MKTYFKEGSAEDTDSVDKPPVIKKQNLQTFCLKYSEFLSFYEEIPCLKC